jgi:transposase InsO family protein
MNLDAITLQTTCRDIRCKKIKDAHMRRDVAEQYVNFIATESLPNAMSLSQVKDASERDPTIQKAIEYARNGRWYEMETLSDPTVDIEELQAYRSMLDELAIHCDTVLLREKRIILSKTLRERAIKIAHEGQQGLAKTKAFLRSKVWFPGINDKVDNLIKDCLACQAITPAKLMEPLKMSELPQEPWSDLSADFCRPLPSGDYLFVIIDEYSRYPVVEIVKSVSSHCVIPTLDKVLSTFGIPKVIKTDNGSPFNSHQFREYARNTGFTHRRVTPRWPRANAQAEAFNKPLMKNIKAAGTKGRNWKQSLFQFLRQYRSTPHSSTGTSPFKLLFNREVKTKLPSVPKRETKNDERLRQNDEISKRQMKSDLDKRLKTRKSSIEIGDHVLLRNETKSKTTPVFDPRPHIVTDKKGNMVTTRQNEKTVTRNSSFFKKTNHQLRNTDTAEEEEIQIPDTATQKNQAESLGTHTPRPTRQRKRPVYLQDYVTCVRGIIIP